MCKLRRPNLLREVFFCSTVIGGIVGNVTSSDNGIVFSTGAAAFFVSFSADEADADEEEEAADADDDSESRGGVLSADSAVASSDEDAPPPKSPFSLPDKSASGFVPKKVNRGIYQ